MTGSSRHELARRQAESTSRRWSRHCVQTQGDYFAQVLPNLLRATDTAVGLRLPKPDTVCTRLALQRLAVSRRAQTSPRRWPTGSKSCAACFRAAGWFQIVTIAADNAHDSRPMSRPTLSGTRTILLVGMNNSAWLLSSARIANACVRSFARRATSMQARLRVRCRCQGERSRRHTQVNRRAATAECEVREANRATRHHTPACLTAAVVMHDSVFRTSTWPWR